MTGETRRARSGDGRMSDSNMPVLLDLFCKAGGATRGYQRAGFYVIGVDIEPQPNYCGDEFVQDDALAFLERVVTAGRPSEYAAIHASPPCQFGTAYKRRPGHVAESPNLIPQVRELLAVAGLPYVIENLWLNRSHLIEPVRYCGSSFGLDVQRHRAFESNVPLKAPACAHGWQTPRFPPATNRTNLRRTVEVGVWRIPLATQQKAMGIDWMTLPELSESIPPAYTNHIGRQLRGHVREGVLGTKGPCLECGQDIAACIERVMRSDRGCCRLCAHEDVLRPLSDNDTPALVGASSETDVSGSDARARSVLPVGDTEHG